MVRALACDSRGRRFDSRPLNLGHVVYTRASVTKQNNLVPVVGHRCPVAGKVTLGPESHWPRVRLQWLDGLKA